MPIYYKNLLAVATIHNHSHIQENLNFSLPCTCLENNSLHGSLPERIWRKSELITESTNSTNLSSPITSLMVAYRRLVVPRCNYCVLKANQCNDPRERAILYHGVTTIAAKIAEPTCDIKHLDKIGRISEEN